MRVARHQVNAWKPAKGGRKTLSIAGGDLAVTLGWSTGLGGCVLAPPGTSDEHFTGQHEDLRPDHDQGRLTFQKQLFDSAADRAEAGGPMQDLQSADRIGDRAK